MVAIIKLPSCRSYSCLLFLATSSTSLRSNDIFLIVQVNVTKIVKSVCKDSIFVIRWKFDGYILVTRHGISMYHSSFYLLQAMIFPSADPFSSKNFATVSITSHLFRTRQRSANDASGRRGSSFNTLSFGVASKRTVYTPVH